MWWCPECGLWCGWKLDECREGHSRPSGALRTGDVDETDSYYRRADSRRERLRRAWLRVLGYVGRRP
jgi:hypothetical protein